MKAARVKFNFQAQSPKWVAECCFPLTNMCLNPRTGISFSSMLPPQRTQPAERGHCLHTQAGRCQLVWRRASWESRYIPNNLRGGEILHSTPFLSSGVSNCSHLITVPLADPAPDREAHSDEVSNHTGVGLRRSCGPVQLHRWPSCRTVFSQSECCEKAAEKMKKEKMEAKVVQ